MKHSMHNWMRPEPIEVTIERLHRFGYDGIEISGEPDRYDTAEVRRLLDRYGLECWGAVTIMTEGRDLVHEDRAVRRDTVGYLKECIRMIAELQGSIFCVVPSMVGKTKPMAAPSQEWKWVVEGMREVAEFARERRVRIGIEPINRFETYLINRHDQALALADEVGPDVGVVLDAFHINIEEDDPMAALSATRGRLVDFHIADTNRKPPGQGQHDWRTILNTLREIGYAGHLTAEFCLPVDRTPVSPSWGAETAAEEEGADDAQMKFIRDHGSGLIPAAEYDRAVEQSIRYLKECEQ